MTTYLFNKLNRTTIMFMQRHAILIIKSFFAQYQSLIGKPNFTITANKVIIQVFYYSSTDTISNENLAKLGNALTRCFKRTIELRVIRFNHPTLDGNLLAQYLSKNASQYSFNTLFDLLKKSLPTVASKGSLDENTITPTSQITGIKIQLSGRLTTERTAPRKTVQTHRLGSLAKGSYGVVDYNKYTAKNKLGAFTVKVWVSQHSR